MTATTQLFQIDGMPMPVPDENMALSFEDIDAADAGRDESGVMHRAMVRSKVGKWGFTYTYLDREDMAYLQSILPETGTFLFTYPSPADPSVAQSCRAYLSGYSYLWQGGREGLCRDLKFNIIQC